MNTNRCSRKLYMTQAAQFLSVQLPVRKTGGMIMKAIWSTGMRCMILVAVLAAINVSLAKYANAADEMLADHKILTPAFKYLSECKYDLAYDEALRISKLEGLALSILTRAYAIMSTSLVLRNENEQAEKFWSDIVALHSKDERPLSSGRSVPMKIYLPTMVAQERIFMFERSGDYAGAAKACEVLLARREEAIEYVDASQKGFEEFDARISVRARVGDLYRYAGDYIEAASAYAIAWADLKKFPNLDSLMSQTNVALPPPKYLSAKLPTVIDWCEGDPTSLNVKCGREIDTPIELAERHLALGRHYNDGKSLDEAIRLLTGIETFVETNNIPDSLEQPLKDRYVEVRDKVSKALAFAGTLRASSK